MTRFWLAHGFLGRSEDWLDMQSELTSLMDPSTIGFSPIDLWLDFQKFQPQNLNEWAESWWDERKMQLETRAKINNERHVLIGYSMGGRWALHVLRFARQVFSGVILLSVNPGLPKAADREERKKHDQVWAQKIKNEPWDQWTAKWNNQAVLKTSPVEPRFEIQFNRDVLAQVMEVASLGNQIDLRPALHKMQIPTVWMSGERDLKYTAIGLEMSRLMPNGQQIVIKEAGHRLLLERPEQLALTISALLPSFHLPASLPGHP